MSRFFVDTFGGIIVFDDEGYDLPDREAVKDLVRETLSDLIRKEKIGREPTKFRINVRDESGTQIMVATLVICFEEFYSIN